MTKKNYTNMDVWGQYGVLLIWGKSKVNIVAEHLWNPNCQHHRSIYALLYMSNVYDSSRFVFGCYIDRHSLIFYYHSLLYRLGHGATIVMS